MKKKIAFIPNPLDSTLKSSIGIVSYELASRLTDKYDVGIITGRNGSYEKRGTVGGIDVTRLNVSVDKFLKRFNARLPFYSASRPFFSSQFYYPAFALQLAAAVRGSGADIVHLNNFTQFIPVIRALNPGVKIVLHMHSEWLTQLDARMIGKRIAKADLVLGCSDFITDKIKRKFPAMAGRIRTLHNGVDVRKFSATRNAGAAKPGKQLLYIGRISPEKGVHVLLESFRSIVEKRGDVRLKVVGQERIAPREFIISLSDDPKMKSLEEFYPGSYLEKIKSRMPPEVLSRIDFIGQVTHSEIAKFLGEADLFISPSIYESFGMPVQEAMAAGVPVVATNAGGVVESVLNGKTGLLVERGDPKAIADGVLALLENEDLAKRMVGEARARAGELYSWDRIAQRLSECYESIIDGSGPAVKCPRP